MIKEFCKAYVAWLDDGAPLNHQVFYRDQGLCSAFVRWAHGEGHTPSSIANGRVQMEQMFARNGHYSYPFGGFYMYHADRRNETMHLNTARVAWVRRHAEHD